MMNAGRRGPPRISIVTPSFNQGRYLERTILSVLNQGYPSTEYIIIDGGSTDESVDIIRRYAGDVAYWVSERDRGQADALRRGFARCTGEISAYLNSDDVYLPDALWTVARRFLSAPTCDVVYGDGVMIDDQSRVLREDRFAPYLTAGLMRGGTGFCQPAVFWRHSAYLRVGGIDEGFQFCIDLDLLVRLHRHGCTFSYVRRPLGAYRVHQESKTTKMLAVWKAESQRICAAYLERTPPLRRKLFVLAIRTFKAVYWLVSGSGTWLARRLLAIAAGDSAARFGFRYEHAANAVRRDSSLS